MGTKLAALSSAALLICGSSPAIAAVQLTDHLTFSGFGTVAAARGSNDRAPFVRDSVQPSGAGSEPTFDVDSNLGLQLTLRANSWLSATVQSLTTQRTQPSLTTETEWAFVKVEPLPGLALRGGRFTLPTFAVSDSRNVGYANNWLRPPAEVYGLAILKRLEGVDVSYGVDIGSTKLTATALYGKSKVIDGTGGRFRADVDDVKGVNLVWDADWVTLRAGRVQGQTDLSAIRPGTSDGYVFNGVGALVDRNNIVLQAEYVWRGADSVDNDLRLAAKGWYVMGGYRFGRVLPYAIYGSTSPDTAGGSSPKQQTIAAGLRWDAFSAAALKLQVERIDTDGTAGLSFATLYDTRRRALTPVAKPVTLISVAADFVF